MTHPIPRSAVVSAARSMLGTPWKHQGRSTRKVDCVGLVYVVAEKIGALPEGVVIPPYRREPDGSVQSYFEKYMDRVSRTNLKPGTVLLHSFAGSPFHASIVVDPDAGAIIHAYASRRAVVLDLFKGRKNGMILHAAYDFKGVTDG